MTKIHMTTKSEQNVSFGMVLVYIGTAMIIIGQFLLNAAMLLCGPCNPMLFPVGLAYFLGGGIMATVGVFLWDQHLQSEKSKHKHQDNRLYTHPETESSQSATGKC